MTGAYVALFAIAMNFLGALQARESNESALQLLCATSLEENGSLQEEWEVQPEKIYIEPHEVSIVDNQVFAYLNGQWEIVAGLYADAEGLYVVSRGYHPDCPPNFQNPVCPNVHTAVYEVVDPSGNHYRFVCNYHGCDYEFHNYIRKYLPPGYYLKGIEKKRH